MAKRFALFILGRPTFDVDYAGQRIEVALEALGPAGIMAIGSREILFDNDAVASTLDAVDPERIDGVLVLQSTFTDAGAVVSIAERLKRPVHIWGWSEPRTGGRLRLNAFCGINLAAHALGLRALPFVPLYADPESVDIADRLYDFAHRDSFSAPPLRDAVPAKEPTAAVSRALAALKGARIGKIGEHPDGFDTCGFAPEGLAALGDIAVESISLDTLFDTARAVDDATARETRESLEGDVAELERVDAKELERSLKLKTALDQLKEQGNYTGFAIRCWPETFTEYGGAVCGPVAMMGERRTPCACEADVYGALTSLLLQELADAPAFLADIVDMDDGSDTTVVWHCGQAPLSLADPDYQKTAEIHSNRRMPLLFGFPLKPGRVTLARLSQARGEPALVIGTGEVVKADPSFSGTSGVVRLDTNAAEARARLLAGAVEHHLALVYGDHAAELEAVAAALDLPVLDLTA